MKKIILTALVAASLVSVASADSLMNTSNGDTLRANASLGLGFGFASGIIGGVSIAYDHPIQNNFSVGAEAGITMMPDYSDSNSLLRIPVFATVHYNFESVQNLDAFFKAGLAVNMVDSENTINAIFAMGAGYDLNDKINLFGQYNFAAADSFGYLAAGISYKLPVL